MRKVKRNRLTRQKWTITDKELENYADIFFDILTIGFLGVVIVGLAML